MIALRRKIQVPTYDGGTSVFKAMSTDTYDIGYDHGYFQTLAHVIAAGVGLSVLDIVSVSLRFLARRKQKQPLKVEDWLLVPATVRIPTLIPATHTE